MHLYKSLKKVFSFSENGLFITELDYCWHEPSLASLLLIDSRSGIFGLFFDRELSLIEKGVSTSVSRLVVCTDEITILKHSDKSELKYELVDNSGIFIGNNRQ